MSGGGGADQQAGIFVIPSPKQNLGQLNDFLSIKEIAFKFDFRLYIEII